MLDVDELELELERCRELLEARELVATPGPDGGTIWVSREEALERLPLLGAVLVGTVALAALMAGLERLGERRDARRSGIIYVEED